MIYEVRIVKREARQTGIVTLIEHIEAKNIVAAEIMAKKLAKDVEGSLKAITSKPYEMRFFKKHKSKSEEKAEKRIKTINVIYDEDAVSYKDVDNVK